MINRIKNNEKTIVAVGSLLLLLFFFWICIWLPAQDIERLNQLLKLNVSIPKQLEKEVVLFIVMYVAIIINYNFLIEKYLFKRIHTIYFFSIVILLLGIQLVEQYYWNVTKNQDLVLNIKSRALIKPKILQFDNSLPEIIVEKLPSNNPIPLLITIAMLGLTSGFAIINRNHQEQLKRQILEKELTNAALNTLKNQFHPHFFFNILNNIYSLIGRDTKIAQETVFRFSKLMRYILENQHTNFQNLASEIEFINHYLALQKLRIGQNVSIEFKSDEIKSEEKTPSMVLFTLVENAFKYGIHPIDPSYIQITLLQNEKNIILKVINSNFNRIINCEENSSGFGLRYIKQKLELLYKDNFVMKTNNSLEYFEAYISYPKYSKIC